MNANERSGRPFVGVLNVADGESSTGVPAGLGALVNGQGSNSVNIRQFNERVVLSALRRLGQASKADLSRSVNLTHNATGMIVKELDARGLVRDDGKRLGARGQPATLLSLDPEGAYGIGVMFGRRSIECLLVDFCGTVIGRRHHVRDFPLPEEALNQALSDIEELRASLPPKARSRLSGIGVAMPYDMGSWRRELDIPHDVYATWNEIDIADLVSQRTGLPVFRENDGTSAAVAELFQGAGRELDSFVYVYIGAAVGGGVILNGDYFRGSHGNAGDIGLMPVAPSRLDTAPTPTHGYDILLTRASINALIRHLRARGAAIGGQQNLPKAIADNPAAVNEWLDDCADALVAPLLASARLLDVEVVIIDGDLPATLLPELIRRVSLALAAAAPEARTPPSLRQGVIGTDASALGAALLPLHLNYSPNREILVNG